MEEVLLHPTGQVMLVMDMVGIGKEALSFVWNTSFKCFFCIVIYFRRDSEDTEWIRILTLLDVGSDLYNTMSQKNMEDNCPAKILCQAFESPDIFGV